jgi:hypothetical protein
MGILVHITATRQRLCADLRRAIAADERPEEVRIRGHKRGVRCGVELGAAHGITR